MMRTADRVALLLGQMIRLLREAPDETDDLKSALRTLTEVADKRSLSIRADADGVTVEGIAVEGDRTLIDLLSQQMQAHLVAEMRIAHGASAIDIMHLVRGSRTTSVTMAGATLSTPIYNTSGPRRFRRSARQPTLRANTGATCGSPMRSKPPG